MVPVTPPDQLTTSALLYRIAQPLDGSSLQEITEVLTMALGAADYLDCIRDLRGQGIDPQSYIDSLGQVGSHSTPAQHMTHDDLAVDHRHLFTRSGSPEMLYSGLEEDVHFISAAPYLLYTCFEAQQTRPTAVHIRRVRRRLEDRRRKRPSVCSQITPRIRA